MSLRYILLGMLNTKAYHGYELRQKVDDLFGKTWPVSYGQLYPTLKTLHDSGFLRKATETGERYRDKYVYEITPRGKAFYQKWLDREPKRILYSAKDEFTAYISLLSITKQNDKLQKSVKIHKQEMGKAKTGIEKNLQKAEKTGDVVKSVLLKRMLLRIQADEEWLDSLLES